ncbi:MAG: histidine kinase [Bryobacterales bacterium]|nr:histidine kinase [Bryobacterales bacterium]
MESPSESALGAGKLERHSNAGIKYPGAGTLFVVWTAVGVLTSFRYHFYGPPKLDAGDLGFYLACIAFYYPWIALSPLVFRLERRFPLSGHGWPRHLVVLLALSAPICLLATPVMSAVFAGVVSIFGRGWKAWPLGFWFMHFPTTEILFWASVAGGYFVRTHFELREQQREAARLALERSELEASLKQAQLDAIRARLNPHFLFNCLQNISVLARQDSDTASRMLARLGDLLRAVLRRDSEPECTLHEELELARAYIALEQMRFGEKLEARFVVEREVESAWVPSFLLQPLIENAVIHGLRNVRSTGLIAVSARQEGSELVITVADNGKGLPDEQATTPVGGLGLHATRERLAILYPGRHSLTIRNVPGGGTEVTIRIPLRCANEPEEPARHGEAASVDRG